MATSYVIMHYSLRGEGRGSQRGEAMYMWTRWVPLFHLFAFPGEGSIRQFCEVSAEFMGEMDQHEDAVGEAQQRLMSLLCNQGRDFLIKNNGDQVKVKDLGGKFVGLYFSAQWHPPCRAFTGLLSEIYTKLLEKGDFEVVFISEDEDGGLFREYHSEMPWLALPFSDSQTREKLSRILNVTGIPTLVMLAKEGTPISAEGVEIIEEFGAEGYPFTADRLDELKAQEAAIRAAQTLESILVSDERDFVVAPTGQKVSVSELVGKTVCLYFAAHWSIPCQNFTPQLIEVYDELKRKGEAFEIVFISADREREAFQESYGSMPWLALPFGDKIEKKLSRYFRIQGIPTLIPLSPSGKTLQTDSVELIRDYGIQAYPFTAERVAELEAQDQARREAQTLESLLVSDERDFVIKPDGIKLPVSELVGKTIALYFSDHRCPPCADFTAKLGQIYNELQERGEAFEVVVISSDEDQKEFDDDYVRVPWPTLPFGDKTKKYLTRIFHVKGIPTLIVIGPDGKTVTTDGVSVVSIHGAKAYPFTNAQLLKLQKEIEDLAEKLPHEMKLSLHEHSLSLTQKEDYNCDGCDEEGTAWSFYCKDCEFDLHLACALKAMQLVGNDDNQQETETSLPEKIYPARVI